MKKAFTMLELIMVIVVIGILAAVVVPRTGSNKLGEAAVQLVSHIRYTQHLAMVDDKFDSTDPDNWYKKRWQIIFSNTTTASDILYSIYSDGSTYTGNADAGEVASDPMSPDKFLSGGSASILQTDVRVNEKLNLTSTYGITGLTLNDGCSGVRISFDTFGRPLHGTIHDSATSYESSNLIQSTCNIVLVSAEGDITIAVEPETGYVHIQEFD